MSASVPKQLIDVEGVSLTATIQGTKKRATVLVDDTYTFVVPRELLRRLNANQGGRLFKALDLNQPIWCMAVIEADGSKLYDLRRVVLPQELSEAIPASSSSARAASRRVSRQDSRPRSSDPDAAVTSSQRIARSLNRV